MSALLASVRQIGRDLIDKRLWPVAVVLLAALVAAPMLIGGSGGETAPPAAGAVAAAPGAAPATPRAVANTADAKEGAKPRPARPERGGTIDDPFFDPPKAPAAAAAADGAGAGGAPGGATKAVAASPTGAAAPRPGASSAEPPKAERPAATTPVPKPAATRPSATRRPAVTAPAAAYLRTVVRVNAGRRHPIARLTPLGGSAQPAALFLGIANASARYAVFVIGPRATSHGQATCKGDTGCRMIGLKAGQTQTVTVRLADGAVRRYRLRVESIRKVATTAPRARAARAHVHADGRRVLRVMRRHAASDAALRAARYDTRAGLLRATGADAVENAAK